MLIKLELTLFFSPIKLLEQECHSSIRWLRHHFFPIYATIEWDAPAKMDHLFRTRRDLDYSLRESNFSISSPNLAQAFSKKYTKISFRNRIKINNQIPMTRDSFINNNQKLRNYVEFGLTRFKCWSYYKSVISI